MSRSLRVTLLAGIALAFAYLVLHAREPLRLSIGDPWSDANVLTAIKYVKSDGFLATSFTDVLDVGPLTEESYRYVHYPPFAEIVYGTLGKLGVSDIGTYRLFAIVFSALAMWLLHAYLRRMYTPRIALLATALWSTSMFWMMYADSIHQAPIMTCTGFLALWGLVRVIETKQRRHAIAAFAGSFACFFTSYDYYLFLPAAVLFTVYMKRGAPLSRDNRRYVALCALGCLLGIVVKSLAVIGAVGWNEFLADLHFQFLERSGSTHDSRFASTLVRRVTLVFTPLIWVTVAAQVVHAIRSSSIGAALRDTAVWMLVAALAFMYLFSQLATSQVLPSQVLLPFYAVGSAFVIDRLLDGPYAALGRVWIGVAMAWSFIFMFVHPRSLLRRDDIAQTTAYLAEHDRNDFVMSNLISDGHIQAAFDRHNWGALDAKKGDGAEIAMLGVFESMGTETVHHIIFTDTDSRFIDKALWPLSAKQRLWAVTGWPDVWRAKTRSVIREYDQRVMANLDAIRAERVLELHNYAVYRSDRRSLIALLAGEVPDVQSIDFGSVDSRVHLLLGWAEKERLTDIAPVATVAGFTRCAHGRRADRNACATVLTKNGVHIKDQVFAATGQLMIRVARSCDLPLVFTFPRTSQVSIAINGYTATAPPGTTAAFTVPAARVEAGINVVELTNVLPGTTLDVSSLDMSAGVVSRCW